MVDIIEIIRINDILEEWVPKEESARLSFALGDLARESDEVVRRILRHPAVTRQYKLTNKNGFIELSRNVTGNMSVHFLRSGGWLLKSLRRENLSPFYNGKNYDQDGLLKWFGTDLRFNKLRLEQLEKTGSLTILDPRKVRVVVIDPKNSRKKKP